MGMTSTSESQGQAGPQSAEAQRIMQLLSGGAGQAAGQMGDLSSMAAGDFSLTPQDRALVSEAQAASGDVARSQMGANMDMVLRQLEDTNIGRQLTGGSLEAVSNALIGRDSQRQLNELDMQQQGQAAGQLLNMPFQRAQSQLGANQLLLNRLVQGGGQALNYDALIRQLNASSTGSETTPLTSTLVQGGAQVGASAVMPT